MDLTGWVGGRDSGGAEGGGGGADGAENEGAAGGGVGGGGGAPGDVGPLPNAFLAACIAIDGMENPLGSDGALEGGGGGAGVDRIGGGRGAVMGGGGGGAGGVGTLEDGGGGGGGGGCAAVDGFFDPTGGGGGLDMVGGIGGALGGLASDRDVRVGTSALGLGTGFKGDLRRFATRWLVSSGGDDSVVWGPGRRALIRGAGGGFGADEVGGFGAELRDVSGSDT